MLLELGPGTNPHPRCNVGIDINHPIGSNEQDAAQTPWYWGSGTFPEVIPDGLFDHVFSAHFLEHIRSGGDRIAVMNEAWRVLKPGGWFTAIVPLVGYDDGSAHGQLVNGWQPYADPTHVSFWWLPESVQYFCEGPFGAAADYGMKEWAPLGPLIENEMLVKRELGILANTLSVEHDSFWAVRGGWEGVFRIRKPA